MLCFLTDKIGWPWQLGTQYFVKIKDDWHMKKWYRLAGAGICWGWVLPILGFPFKDDQDSSKNARAWRAIVARWGGPTSYSLNVCPLCVAWDFPILPCAPPLYLEFVLGYLHFILFSKGPHPPWQQTRILKTSAWLQSSSVCFSDARDIWATFGLFLACYFERWWTVRPGLMPYCCATRSPGACQERCLPIRQTRQESESIGLGTRTAHGLLPMHSRVYRDQRCPTIHCSVDRTTVDTWSQNVLKMWYVKWQIGTTRPDTNCQRTSKFLLDESRSKRQSKKRSRGKSSRQSDARSSVGPEEPPVLWSEMMYTQCMIHICICILII